MSSWDLMDMPDQTGRTVVITGANSGLGYETALGFVLHGARVILAVRNTDKGDDAARRLREHTDPAEVDVRQLDLADLESVRAFAANLDAERIDVLINNAGVMALPRRESAQGYELQFATNHLGHFALTGLLLERITDRVVTLSSNAHKMGTISFDNLQGTKRYFRWAAYGQAKLANLLFALELERRLGAAGSSLRSLAAHPGYAATNLQYQASDETGNPLDRLANKILNTTVAQSAARGALPTLYAATEDLPGGTYVGPDGAGEFRGGPQVTAPNGRARDPEVAARLWEVSEELTGVRYAL